MIVGLQCRSSDRADAANNLVSMLGAPVLATYKAKGVIPDTHPLYVGLYTGAKLDNTVLTEADLIIFFGADPIEMIPGDWPHSAPVIVISETPQLAWPFKPKTELTGSVLKNARALGIHRNNTAWTKLEIETHRKRLRNAIAISKTAGRSPDEIINAVIATAPKNSRLAVDAGAHMFSCMTHWPADRPHDVLKSNGLWYGLRYSSSISQLPSRTKSSCYRFDWRWRHDDVDGRTLYSRQVRCQSNCRRDE